jgi:hypothetical protein
MSISGSKNAIELIKRKLEYAKSGGENGVDALMRHRNDLISRAKTQEDIERITREYEMKIRVAKEIEEHSTNNSGCFRALIGIPDGMTEAEYKDKWYDTNINYYGTKWDIDLEEWEWDFDEDSVHVNFESAWSPPCNFLRHLVEKYEGITFGEIEYEEQGCDFYGRYTVTRDENGYVSINDDCLGYEEGIYKYNESYFWERLYDECRCAIEECNNDKADLMERYFFVREDDLKEVEKVIDEIILELKTEENEQEA